MRRQREPFRELSRRLIAETLTKYLPEDGRVVEIGMGDGQLYERLPEAVLARTLHTEPQAASSRAFRQQHPSVSVVQAPAERLPLEAGEAAAVLGSCVMDVVPDPVAVVDELARVLRPGGRFIHFLDMSTLLQPIIAALEATELLPIPNVFGDVAGSTWPEDLFLLPRQQLATVVAILREAGHGLARPLAQYLALFSASPLAVGPAAAELVQLQDDAALRDALRDAFQAARKLASPELRQQLATFQGRPVSSARHFEQRLHGWFTAESGFEIAASELVSAWERVPRGDSPFAYVGKSVGEQRQLPYVPDSLLCADAHARATAGDAETLRELGIFAFVATRI